MEEPPFRLRDEPTAVLVRQTLITERDSSQTEYVREELRAPGDEVQEQVKHIYGHGHLPLHQDARPPHGQVDRWGEEKEHADECAGSRGVVLVADVQVVLGRCFDEAGEKLVDEVDAQRNEVLDLEPRQVQREHRVVAEVLDHGNAARPVAGGFFLEACALLGLVDILAGDLDDVLQHPPKALERLAHELKDHTRDALDPVKRLFNHPPEATGALDDALDLLPDPLDPVDDRFEDVGDRLHDIVLDKVPDRLEDFVLDHVDQSLKGRGAVGKGEK